MTSDVTTPPTSVPGPPRRLTHEQILDAAVRILEENVNGLSLRRLASDLDVTPMTLYRYFGSKDEILDAAIAHSVHRPPNAAAPDGPWHEQLRNLVLGIRDSLAERPGIAVLTATRSRTGAGTDELRERILTLLLGAGLSDDEALAGLGAITRYLIGCVMMQANDRRDDVPAEVARLAALGPEFPSLTRLADRYLEHESDAAMEFGLDLILSDLRRIADRPRR